MNTQDELTSIRQREEAATKGPWANGGRGLVETIPAPGQPDFMPEIIAATKLKDSDAEFIAHARADVPRLLAAVDAVLALADDWARGGAGWHIRTAVNDALEAGK